MNMPNGSTGLRRVCYSLKDIPDGLVPIDEMDLELKWEIANGANDPDPTQMAGVEELNELFEQRVGRLLLEKKASCAHVRREKISHTRSYAHGSSIVTGEYLITLYGPPAQESTKELPK